LDIRHHTAEISDFKTDKSLGTDHESTQDDLTALGHSREQVAG